MATQAMAERTGARTLPTRWGAIVPGALVCLGVQVAFTLLASGLGFALLGAGSEASRAKQVGAVGFGLVALVVSFLVGGFTASRLAPSRTRSASVLLGSATWALVVVVLVFAGARLATSFGGFLASAGIGAVKAGGSDAFTEALERLKPRLVTDVKLKDGRLVTRLVTEKTAADEAGREPAPAPEPAAEAAREVATGASFGAFAAILLAALAAIVGSLLALPAPVGAGARGLLRRLVRPA
jgi:hypothetical protein